MEASILRRYFTASLLPVVAWVGLLSLLGVVTRPMQVAVLVGLALLLDAHRVEDAMASFMLVASSNALMRFAFGIEQNPVLDAAFATAFVMYFISREKTAAEASGETDVGGQEVDLRLLLLEGEERLRAFLPPQLEVSGSLFSTTALGESVRGVVFRIVSTERVIATIVVHNDLGYGAMQALQADFRQEVEPVVSHPLDQHPRFDRIVEDLAQLKYLKVSEAQEPAPVVPAPPLAPQDERKAA